MKEAVVVSQIRNEGVMWWQNCGVSNIFLITHQHFCFIRWERERERWEISVWRKTADCSKDWLLMGYHESDLGSRTKPFQINLYTYNKIRAEVWGLGFCFVFFCSFICMLFKLSKMNKKCERGMSRNHPNTVCLHPLRSHNWQSCKNCSANNKVISFFSKSMNIPKN